MLQCLQILLMLQQNMFVVKGRYLSKPSRLFMVHGDAHICILTYYFKNEMLGAQKNTCAREEYHLFRVLQQKRKLFCILHFFSYFMMVHSKSNDKLISSLEKDEIVFITISKQKISNPANNIIEIRQQWGNLLKSLGR